MAVVPDIPNLVCVWDVTIRFLDSGTSSIPIYCQELYMIDEAMKVRVRMRMVD